MTENETQSAFDEVGATQGAVLYVGKARNLSKRVSSYAKPTGHSARIGRMISATASMMFLTTETETEALLFLRSKSIAERVRRKGGTSAPLPLRGR